MSAQSPAAKFGDPANPLLVSVRSGARASMPGMMDTVLNLGLNDETVEALAKAPATRASPTTAIAASSRCIPTSCSTSTPRCSRRSSRTARTSAAIELDTDLAADDWRSVIARYKAAVERETGKPFPQDPHEQLWGAIGAVFAQLDEPARHHLSPPARHPGKLGHGGQRPGDGVRQHGRDLGHRRRLHPQSLDRRERALRRVPGQRAGRGRRGRHPHAAEHHRGARASRPVPTSRRWRR